MLACAEAAIERIEKGAFGIVFEDIRDVKSMMDRLGALADKMSPTMRFLVSVCVSREYGEKVKFALSRLASRYPYYTEKSRRFWIVRPSRSSRSFTCRFSPSTTI